MHSETAVTCLGIQSGRSDIFKDKGTHAIPAGLVSIAKTLLQPKCGGHRNEQRKWDTHTMLYDSAIKHNETMGSSGTGKKVEMIIAAEDRQ